MHPCQFLLVLTFLIASLLQVAAQAPLVFNQPGTLYECVTAYFSWNGGNAPFQFWAKRYDDGLPEFLVATTNSQYYYYAPPKGTAQGGMTFKIVDASGNHAELELGISPGACGASTTVATTTTRTSIFYTMTSTYYSSTPPPGTTLPSPPPSTGDTSTTVTYSSTTVLGSLTSATGTITTKQTANPTGNPSNPSESHPTSPGDPNSNPDTQVPGSGSNGNNGVSDGSLAPGETRTRTGGGGGQNPTQTASPYRNTQDGEEKNVSMSPQAKGAIIGTVTTAFLLFIGFLCFRWRRRHQQKHRPVPILPGVGSSGDDLTTAVIPTVYHDPPPMQSTGHPLGAAPGVAYAYPASPSTSRPVPAPLRLLPSSKQAMAARPRPPSSEYGSEGTASLNAPGTWRSSQEETSRDGSMSHFPEDQIPPPPAPPGGPAYPDGHEPATPGYSSGYLGHQNLQPTVGTRPDPSPLSLQQLIGRELDNILSSPATYSPDSPLYTPTSASIRDPLIGGLRVVNNGPEPSSSSGVASSSKHPQGLRGNGSASSQRGNGGGPRTPTPEIVGSASASAEDLPREGGGGSGIQRVTISRNEMEYLADLVAARITRDTGQRTQPGRSDVAPPSYV